MGHKKIAMHSRPGSLIIEGMDNYQELSEVIKNAFFIGSEVNSSKYDTMDNS